MQLFKEETTFEARDFGSLWFVQRGSDKAKLNEIRYDAACDTMDNFNEDDS